jgi:hypothetical protein
MIEASEAVANRLDCEMEVLASCGYGAVEHDSNFVVVHVPLKAKDQAEPLLLGKPLDFLVCGAHELLGGRTSARTKLS